MHDPSPKAPPARETTPRAALLEALQVAREVGATATARELSSSAGLTERDVLTHLEHLARSLPHDGLALAIEPATCLACGYVFRDRARLSSPGQCPTCRSERVAPPSFSLRDAPPKPPKPPRRRDRDDDA